MNRSFYFALLSIYNNCIMNIYFCGYLIFPKYFLNKITEYKKLSDEYYNKIHILSFADDIYNKYEIDLIDIHKNILDTINNFKKNKTTYGLGNEYFNDDNISVMSSISDISDISNISSDYDN